MKIKNSTLTAVILSIMLSFTACEKDFLVKSDPGSATVDGFFQTADDFKLGVNGHCGPKSGSQGMPNSTRCQPAHHYR